MSTRKIWSAILFLMIFGAVVQADDALPLSIATAEYPHIESVRNGTIKIPECRISYSTFTVEDLAKRFDRGEVGDVIEVDFLRCLARFNQEPKQDWVLVPVFLWREFPQRHVLIQTVEDPSHHGLSGRRLAVDTNNASLRVWARGIFESSPTFKADHYDWDQSLLSASDKVVPAYPDSKTAEENYFRQTRIFPIMTVLAVRAELVKANPWLPEALFIAFSAAKSQALDAGTIPLPWGPQYRDETIALMKKNYWSYGVHNNPKTLEALFKYAHEQGVTDKLLTADDVFAPETLQLIDEKGAKN